MAKTKSLIIFLVLNLLDCITTYIGVTNGLSEGNILLSRLFEINIFLGLGVKMLLAFIIALLINKKYFKPLNIAFIIIIIWNATLLILN